MAELTPPLIVTLKLDAASFTWLNALRQAHFPPERNFLPAHITLFHALPGQEEPLIREQLLALSANAVPVQLELSRLRMLGRGVAIEVGSTVLENLRALLAQRFHCWLTPQDRQGYRPHVTIQNKVLPEEARNLYEKLSREWAPARALGEGLLLWEYLGGPWRNIGEFAFTGTDDRPKLS